MISPLLIASAGAALAFPCGHVNHRFACPAKEAAAEQAARRRGRNSVCSRSSRMLLDVSTARSRRCLLRQGKIRCGDDQGVTNKIRERRTMTAVGRRRKHGSLSTGDGPREAVTASATEVRAAAADTTPSGEVTPAMSAPRTRYTIDVGVHPEVASLAIKHVNTLPLFLESYPISTHTQKAYAEATKFLRDFHRARQDLIQRETPARASGAPEARLGGVEGAQGVLGRPCPQEGRFPVVLDSGCGTGRSSVLLARMYPHLPVVGVDRSAVRLSKGRRRAGASCDSDCVTGGLRNLARCDEKMDQDVGDRTEGVADGSHPVEGGGDVNVCRNGGLKGEFPSNLLLLRADLVDLWILASRDNIWSVEEHSILYPNPYPKHSQLRSRWHGHPVFPVLLSLGGRITLRSNWKAYLDEFCLAVLAISDEPGKKKAGVRGAPDGDVDPGRQDQEEPLSEGCAGRGLGGVATFSAAVVMEEYGSADGFDRILARRSAVTCSGGASTSAESTCVTSHKDRTSDKNSGSSDGGHEEFVNGGFGYPRKMEESTVVTAAAASYRASARAGPARYQPLTPATNFEAKYEAVGETLYELRLEPDAGR